MKMTLPPMANVAEVEGVVLAEGRHPNDGEHVHEAHEEEGDVAAANGAAHDRLRDDPEVREKPGQAPRNSKVKSTRGWPRLRADSRPRIWISSQTAGPTWKSSGPAL